VLETFDTLCTLKVWPPPLLMLEPLLLELGLVEEAELLGLLADAELLFELPVTRTSSPTWLASFEVSPARL
jgi:hypothetical protein